MKKLILTLIFTILIIYPAYSLDTKASHALVFDFDTNDILFQKNINDKSYPASMTKIMTTYIIFDRIKNGSLSFDETFKVSRNAYNKRGSRMFLEIDDKVTVRDLIYGIIVQSGNDASTAIAENISGTEEEFAILMNQYAINLGMKNTNFINASGWPDANHYSTMYDLTILSKAIINDFPELYKIFSAKSFEYNSINQPNRNTLLTSYDGVDGLKTGYVKDSGYGIIVSAIKNNRRIIVAINGLKSNSERLKEAEKLLDWAFRDTTQYKLISENEIMTKTDVWLGNKKFLNLKSEIEFFTALTFEQKQNIDLKLIYDRPVEAPIDLNQKIGVMEINIPNRNTIKINLIANEKINKINPLLRIFYALKYLILGNIENE